MSKKNADHHDEEKDREEEEETEEEEEEEEEGHASASASANRRPRGRVRRADDHAAHGHDDHDDEEEEDDEDDEDADDPYWWTPHAVLSGLVLLGVLGFFGIFNKAAAAITGKPMGVAASSVSQPATKEKDRGGSAAPTPAGAATPPAQREEFGAKHLLVMYKGSLRAPPTITRSEEEAKARATEAMKKAKSGTKFEDVVKEYSDEPGAGARGGDLGKFRKGSMVPDFQAAVEKLKVGEISDLVKTPFGYHVILRTQ
jgi:parvulin-like peptidyl-prolyl isomerase